MPPTAAEPGAADPGYDARVSPPAFDEAPTHAGGVVVRRRDGLPELLLVTGRRHRERWVLPKGPLGPGEDPAGAAVREVSAEAGVEAAVVAQLDDAELVVDGERQRVRWFLLESSAQRETDELREVVWLDPRAALERLTFADARVVAEHALAHLAATADAGL